MAATSIQPRRADRRAVALLAVIPHLTPRQHGGREYGSRLHQWKAIEGDTEPEAVCAARVKAANQDGLVRLARLLDGSRHRKVKFETIMHSPASQAA